MTATLQVLELHRVIATGQVRWVRTARGIVAVEILRWSSTAIAVVLAGNTELAIHGARLHQTYREAALEPPPRPEADPLALEAPAAEGGGL